MIDKNMSMEKRSSLFKIGGIDTTFVLFFLALEFGRGSDVLSIDGTMMGITLVMVLVLPYFLLDMQSRPPLSGWLLGRGILASAAFVLGIGVSKMTGTLPEGIGLLPMTFLILTSVVSCYIQFYSVLKLRQAN